jgi:hypothetical protein
LLTKRCIQEVEEKLDIAVEVAIAESMGLYYNDVFSHVDADKHVAKNSLLSYLRDYKQTRKNGDVYRKGIMTLYEESFPEHFEGGIWRARYFFNFVEFMVERLVDKNFMKNTAKISMFKVSLNDKDWFKKAVTLSGVKLLEDLLQKGALRSGWARTAVAYTLNTRTLIEKLAAVYHKSNELSEEALEGIRDKVDLMLRESFFKNMVLDDNHPDVKAFKEFKGEYHKSFEFIYNTRCKLLES